MNSKRTDSAAVEWLVNAIERFKSFLDGIDGFPGAYSEYGQVYASVGFMTDFDVRNSAADLEGHFLKLLLKCRQRGAAVIVWRKRPEMTEQDGKHRIFARFHCLPAVAFDEEDMKPEGEPFKTI